MQICIWTEMIAAGMYCNTGDPPNTTMFSRAGEVTPSRKKNDQQSPIVQALSKAATVITSALSLRPGMEWKPAHQS